MVSTHLDQNKLFEKVKKISNVYGFSFFENNPLSVNKKQKKIKITKKHNDRHISHVSQSIKWYLEHMDEEKVRPLFLFHSNIEKDVRSALSASTREEDILCSLTIVGLKDAYAEAILTACVSDIFESCNSKPLVRINSIGTKKDAIRHFSQVQNVVKKFKNTMPPKLRRTLDKEGVAALCSLIYKENDCEDIIESIVPSIRTLPDVCRTHLYDYIEHLEIQDLPYEFAHDLVDEIDVATHMLFEIKDSKERLYAKGARFDTLAESIFKKEIPVVSVNITIPSKTKGLYKSKTRVKKPKGFFLHSGTEARKKSLNVFKILSQLNIPVSHSMEYTKVQDQLESVNGMYSHFFIFGQEEVESNTIRIRNTQTQAINIIPLSNPEKIKSIF